MVQVRAIVKKIFGEYSMWILFAVMYLCAGFFIPTLLSTENFQNVLIQGTVIGILSIAMAFAFLIGEVDLSVVAVAGFAPLMGLFAMNLFGIPAIAAFILTLLVGAGVGFYNGFMMEKLGVPSLVQTVVTWWILSGIVLVLTEGETKAVLSSEWRWVGNGFIGPVRALLVFFVLFVIIMWVFARHTKTGLRIYLTGGNRTSAQAAGIPTSKIRILAFVLSGTISAFAGYTLAARLGGISARFGTEWLALALAAPVISGVSLTGGRGNLINVVGGAFIVMIIVTIIRLAGIGGFYYDLSQGLLVFFAMLIDIARRKVMGIKW
jgi:simple sugar transport system permease protein/ribose transport system permease protein